MHSMTIDPRGDGARARRAAVRRAIPAAIAALTIAASGGAFLVALAAPVGASNPYRAGEAGIAVASLPDAAQTGMLQRAARLEADLALPSAHRWETTRVADRFDAASYDEATGYDEAGNPVALHRFSTQGRLVAVARLGWHDAKETVKDAAAATRTAERLARRAGFETPGAPNVVHLESGSGWRVTWERLVDGVPAAGDGVRIDLWPDGTLHAAVRTERTLASKPATLIDRDAARAAAEAQLARAGASGNASTGELELRWVAANDAFDASLPDAPSSELRLAWVVRATPGGVLADQVRGIEIFVDAGSGTVIGGDVER